MGEIAALTTSLMWALTSIQFTVAGRRVGSPVVNRTRLLLAVVYLCLLHWLLQGSPWPIHAEPYRWVWLGLSGIVGLVLGDASLFQSFVLIGPRRAMLLMTLAPVISAGLAWAYLGEALQALELAAMLLVVGSVAWVVAERRAGQSPSAPALNRRQYAWGVLLGLGGALGQALGLVMSKQGLQGNFPPLSATLIRMSVAAASIWLLALLQRQAGATWFALHDQRARLFVIGGSLTGPFLGVWLSMAAVQQAHVGIASTLMALSPIVLIPLEGRIFREQISARAVVGTLVTLLGVAVILTT